MRRSLFEVTMDVLTAIAAEPAQIPVSNLMYKAKINYAILKRALSLLEKYKLIVATPLLKKSSGGSGSLVLVHQRVTRKSYTTTDYGKTILQQYSEVVKLMGRFD